jgi:hypothetical protein
MKNFTVDEIKSETINFFDGSISIGEDETPNAITSKGIAGVYDHFSQHYSCSIEVHDEDNIIVAKTRDLVRPEGGVEREEEPPVLPEGTPERERDYAVDVSERGSSDERPLTKETLEEILVQIGPVEQRQRDMDRILGELSGLRTRVLEKEREYAKKHSEGGVYKTASELSSQANEVFSKFDDVKTISIVGSGEGSKIIVTTNMLVTNTLSDDTRRNIGCMKIVIPVKLFFSDSRLNVGCILIQNKTNVIEDDDGNKYNAPHTTDEGISCFGNASAMMRECIIKRDLISLVEVLIKFIKSPNEQDSMGRSVFKFPVH